MPRLRRTRIGSLSRQIAPIALVLGLAVAGFVIARVLADHGARRDSEHRAEVAAAQIRDRVGQAVSLTESLRRFMVDAGGGGVTNAQFSRNAFWWLSPADFSAAAWVEQVPAGKRAAYDRRTGEPIVSPDPPYSGVRPGSRSSFLPATLVSGFPPLSVGGIDLSGEPGMAAALERATSLNDVAATTLGTAAGTRGLFLVAPAPNLIDRVLRPGYVVLFVPEASLLAATDMQGVHLAISVAATANTQGGTTVAKTFQQAGQRFAVVVSQQSVQGMAEFMPWIVLVAGLILAGLAGALGLNAGRRAHAQAELDRIFNLSSDLIAVADFKGHFTRVNPAFERTLGYSSEELRSRPYVEFVHPDDRSATLRAADELSHGRELAEFENRYLRADGSVRWLQWSARSVPGEAVLYAAGRDVTERKQLEQEQAALRRVATMVAQESPPADVFAEVAEAVGALFGLEIAQVFSYDSDGRATVVGNWGDLGAQYRVGSRFDLDGDSVTARIHQTALPVRIDDYLDTSGSIGAEARKAGLRSSVGSPIVVDGRLWGALTAGTTRTGPLAVDLESRLAEFTGLVATAISNVEARAEVGRLVEEQAALQRVATAVARGGSPDDVFAATVAECHAVAAAEATALMRYEADGAATILATLGERAFEVGSRITLNGESVTAEVQRSGRTARIDDFEFASGQIPARLRASGLRSGVGAPIVVEGRLWGVMTCGWKTGPPPQDAEARVSQFTDLVGTAIANAESRAELLASRARIVTTADQTRRRIERDLHDGAQQRLVSMTMKLRALEAGTGLKAGTALDAVTSEVVEIAAGLERVLDDLRETAQGLHPVILSRGGLEPALKALGRRSPVPVELDVTPPGRLPEPIEVAAYYVVAEALTNAAKHAQASFVRVEAEVTDGYLRVSVQDDGSGGADPAHGSGLVGLADRVEALGGKLTLHSPPGGGTTLRIDLPISG